MFGALSSAILVFAIGLVYGITGSTNIGVAVTTFATLGPELIPVGLFAIGLFIAGFGFKMGLVPFHMWIPDTYEGSPTTISALLSAGTKKAGFAAPNSCYHSWNVCIEYRLDLDISDFGGIYDDIGQSGSLMQKSITRILAYSSIAQAGYILIGMALAPYSQEALTGSLFQIFNHAVMKSTAFIATMCGCCSGQL